MGGARRPLFPDAGVWHGRFARTDDREGRDESGTREREARRAAGISLRRNERDEFLQRQPRDTGAGRLSAALARATTGRGPAENRDRARYSTLLERVR